MDIKKLDQKMDPKNELIQKNIKLLVMFHIV